MATPSMGIPPIYGWRGLPWRKSTIPIHLRLLCSATRFVAAHRLAVSRRRLFSLISSLVSRRQWPF